MITQVIKRCNMKTTPQPNVIWAKFQILRLFDGLKICLADKYLVCLRYMNCE